MRWEILSPILIAGAAVTIVALERFYPYDARQRLFRTGFFTDFFWYTLVQSYVLGLVIKAIIEGIDRHSGWSRLHLISGWPVLVQLAFFWVTHDFYIYCFHRLQHRSRWLWRTHEAHHSGKDVDWLAGSRSHSLEILINQTIEYAPIVLLGAHPDVALMKGVLDAIWGMYIHSNIDVRAGRWQYVFNGPEMHRWHHADDERVYQSNFSTKLAIWDWLFGTAYLPPEKAPAYGLWGGEPFPEHPGWRGALSDYFLQHVWAFRPFDREAELRAARPAVAGADGAPAVNTSPSPSLAE
jgi:sterol desaturase/sphingolipid hydroxylase (fatty acid hydroxylase superfamily)